MSQIRKSHFARRGWKRFLIAAIIGLIGFYHCERLATAANLNADGDFGAQIVGNPIGAPWGPVSGGGNAALISAQSPFANVFAKNNIGANTPATPANPYFVGGLTSIPANSTAPLYLNFDFRNNSTDAGDYSIVVTNSSSFVNRSLGLYVTGNTLYAESDSGIGTPILNVLPNAWYNVQLALDTSTPTNTYSGTVTPFGGDGTTYAISSRNFFNSNQAIDSIYSDGGSDGVGGTAPNHDIDNYVLSDTSLAAPSPLRVINVDFNGNSGPTVGPSNIGSAQFPAGNGNFNGLNGTSFTNVPLNDVLGSGTGITLSSNVPNVENSGITDSTNSGTGAFQDTLVTLGTSITPGDTSDDVGTITLNGLADGRPYNLYLFGYFNANAADREATTFTVNGGAPQSTTGALSATTGFTLGEDYVLFSNILPVSNAITISFTGGNPVRDVGVFNGFQLTYVPEPSIGSLLGLGIVGLIRFVRWPQTTKIEEVIL